MRKPVPRTSAIDHLMNEWHRLIQSSAFLLEEPLTMRSKYHETDQACVYMIELPHLPPEHELDVRVNGQMLLVNGRTYENDMAQSGKRSHYHRQLSFSYTFPIHCQIRPEKLTTKLDGNVLTVRLPKR